MSFGSFVPLGQFFPDYIIQLLCLLLLWVSAGELDMLKVVNPENLKSSEPKRVEHCNPTTADHQLEPYNTSMEIDNPGNILGCSTPTHVEMQIAKLGDPPGSTAASMFLEARRQQDCGTMSDIIGIVALLGAVEKEEINRSTAVTHHMLEVLLNR